jgi:hypothetical protein
MNYSDPTDIDRYIEIVDALVEQELKLGNVSTVDRLLNTGGRLKKLKSDMDIRMSNVLTIGAAREMGSVFAEVILEELAAHGIYDDAEGALMRRIFDKVETKYYSLQNNEKEQQKLLGRQR